MRSILQYAARIGSILLVFTALLGLASVTAARTWYIKADGTGDATTIQAGIDSSVAGDVVLVAPGTYNSTLSVQVDGQPTLVNAHITKDISLQSEGGSSVTKIDGSTSAVGVLLSAVGASAEVAGFEITIVPQMIGCVLTAEANQITRATGDRIAIRCDGSGPLIHDNVIHDADMGVRLNSSPATIWKNTFDTLGVGVDGDQSDATVMENEIYNCGEGISFIDSSPHVEQNTVSLTGALYACGGIVCVSHGPASAYTPMIAKNSVGPLWNEGIWCHTVTPTITQNKVHGTLGVVLINCTQVVFETNLLVQNSSGVEIHFSAASLTHNTFDENDDGLFAELSNVSMLRNVVLGGSSGVSASSSVITATCNDVFGMSGPRYSGIPDQTGLNGNLSVDPQFCGTAGSGNYYLQSDSPCAPGNHPDTADCGLIGAFDVNCKTVRVQSTTWGHLKSLYRD